MKNSLKFVAATVSGTIGIGFLSGIEYEKFVGNNILLFGAVFLTSNILFSQWAKTYRKSQVDQLCYATFKRRPCLFTFLIAFTNLLTLVAILSATQGLFAELTSTTLLCFPVVACLIAAAMSKNEKIRNVLSTLTALFSICLLMFIPLSGGVTNHTNYVSPLLTVCYALFCSTMLVGVTAQNAYTCTTKQNVLCNLLSTTILVVLLCLTARFGKLSEQIPNLCNAFRVIVHIGYLLSATTSVYTNCVTPLSLLNDTVKDEELSKYLLFGFCLSLCYFGVDNIMKFSYVGVSVIGIALTTAILTNLLKNRAKIQ